MGDTLGLKYGKKCNFWILAKLKKVKIGMSFGAKFKFGAVFVCSIIKRVRADSSQNCYKVKYNSEFEMGNLFSMATSIPGRYKVDVLNF